MDALFSAMNSELGYDGDARADDERDTNVTFGVTSSTRVLPKTWCHQCKMRKLKVTACDNFFSSDKDVRCNGRYCDACIQRHYSEDPADFVNLSSWICYRCTGRCTCAACKRRRKADEDQEDEKHHLEVMEPRKRDMSRRAMEEMLALEDEDFEPVKRGRPSLATVAKRETRAQQTGATSPQQPQMVMQQSIPQLQNNNNNNNNSNNNNNNNNTNNNNNNNQSRSLDIPSMSYCRPPPMAPRIEKRLPESASLPVFPGATAAAMPPSTPAMMQPPTFAGTTAVNSSSIRNINNNNNNNNNNGGGINNNHHLNHHHHHNHHHNHAPVVATGTATAAALGSSFVPPAAPVVGSSMTALAQLAEESLTSEFAPNHKVLNMEAVQLLNEHTNEIARLKKACLVLQLQVSQLTSQLNLVTSGGHVGMREDL